MLSSLIAAQVTLSTSKVFLESISSLLPLKKSVLGITPEKHRFFAHDVRKIKNKDKNVLRFLQTKNFSPKISLLRCFNQK